MSEFQTIQLEIDPRGVATLWLDRAEKNNAFNAVVIDELLQAIDRVGSDPQVRLLVLRGRGRHFCGGADLAWMQQSVDLDYQGNLADAQRIAELMTHLYNL
ncbi:enoyl-CoA hydratase-related protein, partial [Pseudomonas aeruginosa]